MTAAALALGIGMLVSGCSDYGSDVIVPPDAPFVPEAIAASVHSLRFASSNVAVAQVALIAEVLGLAEPRVT
ncbi:MAG: hypothetical protein ACRELC_06745, partial [Gemmatimonadota bacterium]